MISKELEVMNRAGIHARPASEIAMTASPCSADVFFVEDITPVNAHSIMRCITLGATYRTKLLLTCSGPDEEAAMAAIEGLFERRFEN